MIKNERQYKITKAQLDKFHKSIIELNEKEKQEGSSPLLKLQKSSLESLSDDLEREISEYDDLKSGMISISELHSLDELPQNLIKARLSLRLSQKKLGALVELSEQQIQRYESTEYESASISRIKQIATALELEVSKQLVVPEGKFSIKNFFSKMSDIGLDRNFITKKLLPPSLAAKFEDEEIAPDLLGYQTASYIGKIFGIDPNSILGKEPLVLNTDSLTNVRYKIPSNANKKKVNAYTVYAHYISLLVSQSVKHIPQTNIPDDPYVVRNNIFSTYGEISFENLLKYTWSCGIPVIVLDPTSFHAACFRDSERSIIILTQKTDFEAKWMFNLLHEFYHASQGTTEIAESVKEIHDLDSDEERIANQFADIVLLGQDPHVLAERCLANSNWNVSLIKSNLKKIASEENIRADVLANYIAYRLSNEQKTSLWGISSNLQQPLPHARQMITDQLLSNIDFSSLASPDLELLKSILSVEEAQILG